MGSHVKRGWVRKISLYADESGQHREDGEYFICIVAIEDRESLDLELQSLEVQTGKTGKKWVETRVATKLAFLNSIEPVLVRLGPVYWRRCRNADREDQALLMAKSLIAAASLRDMSAAYFVTVDALHEAGRHLVRKSFSLEKIRILKVRGPKDESEPCLRLADALVGFLGDHTKAKPYTTPTWDRLSAYFRLL